MTLLFVVVSAPTRIVNGYRLAAVTGYALYRTLGEMMMSSFSEASRLYENNFYGSLCIATGLPFVFWQCTGAIDS